MEELVTIFTSTLTMQTIRSLKHWQQPKRLHPTNYNHKVFVPLLVYVENLVSEYVYNSVQVFSPSFPVAWLFLFKIFIMFSEDVDMRHATSDRSNIGLLRTR